jgi:CheY-like chemotaxis protein
MAKILLVEDDKSLRAMYGMRLEADNHQIISVGDGEEALSVAIKERPDLIVSDVMMPKISGFDMLDILRATPETRDIKVIMMTALSSEDQRARGEALGADRYIVKSQVGIEDVVRIVNEVLSGVPAPAPVTPAPTIADTVATPQVDPVVASMPPVPVADATPTTPVMAAPLVTAQIDNTTLPQPTAPFSSPAPASLGEQVTTPAMPAVEPIPAPAPVAMPEVAMSQVEPIATPTPVAPAPNPIAAPVAPEQSTLPPMLNADMNIAPAPVAPEPMAYPAPNPIAAPAPAPEVDLPPVDMMVPAMPEMPTPTAPEPTPPITPTAPTGAPAGSPSMSDLINQELQNT